MERKNYSLCNLRYGTLFHTLPPEQYPHDLGQFVLIKSSWSLQKPSMAAFSAHLSA